MYNRRWFYNIVDKQVAILNAGEMVDADTGKAIAELREGEWLEFNDDPRYYGEQTLAAVGKKYERACPALAHLLPNGVKHD